MMFDGLTCAFDQCAMGLSTERYNQGRISRERQDEFSARSHQLAAAAIAAGKFAEEIVAVAVPQRKGDPIMISIDEGVRGETTAESLSQLRGAFEKDGTITAGNASQISDGGAAVLVMSAERCDNSASRPGRTHQLRPVAAPTPHFSPAFARHPQAAKKADLDVKGLDSSRSTRRSRPSASPAGRSRHRRSQGQRERRAIALGHPSACRARASRSRR